MENNKETASENSYESIWRKPDKTEIKLVSRLMKTVYEEKRPLIRIALFAVVFLTMIFLLVIIWGGINEETEEWLSVLVLPDFFAAIYLAAVYPRAAYKLKNSGKGRFLVADTKVVSKEQNEVRYRGSKQYSYSFKVRVVRSDQGGENDYRTFITDAFDYKRASVGSAGIMVRYDLNLDGHPFMSIDHYLLQ